MKDDSVAFIVSSCDAYADLWAPYFTFLFRYWPDCPYPIYLIANHLRYPDSRVQTILLGEDEGWATNTRRALEQLDQDYIIYTQEDYFLKKAVDNGRIRELLAYAQKREAGYLRLYPCPGPDTVCPDNPNVGEINKGTEYRTSLQAAIWNREVMLSLLRDGEGGWQMEVDGSVRSNALDVPFLSVRGESATDVGDPPLSYFCTAVFRGRWMRAAVDFCEREGVPIDLSRRPVETVWIEYQRQLRPLKNKWRRRLSALKAWLF